MAREGGRISEPSSQRGGGPGSRQQGGAGRTQGVSWAGRSPPAVTQPLVSTLHLPDPGLEVRSSVGLSRGLGQTLRPRGTRAAQAH